MSVQNHAVTGVSSRSFYRELWNSTLATINSGDYVVIEFGHYDNIYPGSVADSDAGCVGTVDGYGSGTQTVTGCNGAPEVVQTYNVSMQRAVWKLNKGTDVTLQTYVTSMCNDVQAKGATCIISSLTPKNEWRRANSLTYVSSFPSFAKQASGAAGATYIPHEEASVKSLSTLGETASAALFLAGDALQPNVAGADTLALSFVGTSAFPDGSYVPKVFC